MVEIEEKIKKHMPLDPNNHNKYEKFIKNSEKLKDFEGQVEHNNYFENTSFIFNKMSEKIDDYLNIMYKTDNIYIRNSISKGLTAIIEENPKRVDYLINKLNDLDEINLGIISMVLHYKNAIQGLILADIYNIDLGEITFSTNEELTQPDLLIQIEELAKEKGVYKEVKFELMGDNFGS